MVALSTRVASRICDGNAARSSPRALRYAEIRISEIRELSYGFSWYSGPVTPVTGARGCHVSFLAVPPQHDLNRIEALEYLAREHDRLFERYLTLKRALANGFRRHHHRRLRELRGLIANHRYALRLFRMGMIGSRQEVSQAIGNHANR